MPGSLISYLDWILYRKMWFFFFNVFKYFKEENWIAIQIYPQVKETNIYLVVFGRKKIEAFYDNVFNRYYKISLVESGRLPR